MRGIALAAGLALGSTLGGCGARGDGENESAAVRAPANEAQRIAGMGDGERNAVFYRALSDGGHDCQNVTSSRRAGESNGVPVWQVVRRGGRTWFIAITANGYAQIVRPGPDEAGASGAHGNSSE